MTNYLEPVSLIIQLLLKIKGSFVSIKKNAVTNPTVSFSILKVKLKVDGSRAGIKLLRFVVMLNKGTFA